MNIVINRCFGGFGVSSEALKRLIELNAIGVEKIAAKQYYGGNMPAPHTDWEQKYQKDLNESKDIGDGYTKHIYLGTLYKDGYVYNFDRGSSYGDENGFACRSDPALIQVVKELGEKANGQSAELEIVEIPDDIDWEIDEYDGIEHIAEKHRTWS